MSKPLLERSRSINKISQKIEGSPVDFYNIARVLSENLECSVFIVGRRGQITGYAFTPNTCCTQVEYLLDYVERFPESFNQELIAIKETKTNIELKQGCKCIFNVDCNNNDFSSVIWTVIPVFGGARRICTLILGRWGIYFSDETVLLAEYGAVVIANEVMRMRSARIEDEARKNISVQIAMASLSYSEKEAIYHIIPKLNSREGVLVTSRIADAEGITRSVIVSALKKIESAGIIETRSLGMKGTYIKILNDYLFEEIR
ncbi:MAG: GTP-sensing pleiotropic transcriptional regulator CodY [Syntrophomonadaceae bacterium]|jgi:transcriptional pleiotropic repressor